MSVLGALSIVLFIHTILSTLRWRMFLQGNSQEVTVLPLDVRAL